jgi:hypothetical protein
LEQETQSLRALADGLWIQRGTLLLSTATWAPPLSEADLVRDAKALDGELKTIDGQIDEGSQESHSGIGALVAKAADWNKHRKLADERDRIAAALRPLLIQIAQKAPEVTVPAADVIGAQARSADTQANEIASRAAESGTLAAGLTTELQRRTEAEHDMGFDSLYVAAYLSTFGPQAVESSLVLKRGEQASVSATATLSRQQTKRQWVGGSQGFSFPIGHTGIRYRVGSFHGHPVEQQFLAKVDTGTLVVTNQRIAFIGAAKSVSVPLAKLLHIQSYSDGLAIFQEGRENPDYFLISQPKYVLFYINWFLGQNAT